MAVSLAISTCYTTTSSQIIQVPDLHIILSAKESSLSAENPSVADLEPLVHDLSGRWKAAIELMEKDIIASFSNSVCGAGILTLTLSELLYYYTRFRERLDEMEGGTALTRQLVSTLTFFFEIRKYFRVYQVLFLFSKSHKQNKHKIGFSPLI